MKKYKRPIPKIKKNLSTIKKKYKKPILKNKKILDVIAKEYKDSLSDSFINKEEKATPKKTQKVKIAKTKQLKIPKTSCDDFVDKVSEKIITQQLKIPKTNMLEVFVVCFGSLYNNIFYENRNNTT